MPFLQPYWGTNILFQLIVLSYNLNILTSAYEMDRENGTSPDPIQPLSKYEPISNIEAEKLISLKGMYIQIIFPIKSMSNIRFIYITHGLISKIWYFIQHVL